MANSVRAGNIPALEKHTTKRWNGLVLGWTATVQSCGTELVEPGLEMANDGHNGYVWTFSTLTERYFLRGAGARRRWMKRCDEFAGVPGQRLLHRGYIHPAGAEAGAGEVMERLYAGILNWSRMAGMSMLPQQARDNSIPWSGNVQWMILMFLVSRNSTTGMKSRSDDAKTATS